MPDSGGIVDSRGFAATVVNFGLGKPAIGVVAVVVPQFDFAIDDFFAGNQLIYRVEAAAKIGVAVAHVDGIEFADEFQGQSGAAIAREVAAGVHVFGHFFLGT